MGSATPKTSTDTAEIAVFSLKVERSKLDKFKRVAESHERSMAQQLRYLIDQEVRAFESNGEAA